MGRKQKYSKEEKIRACNRISNNLRKYRGIMSSGNHLQ